MIDLMNRRMAVMLKKGLRRRPLISYLNGEYETIKQAGELRVPGSPHIVLTGCANDQKSMEKPQFIGNSTDKKRMGFFTNGLISALESVGGKTSYADLQIRTRAYVKQNSPKPQTPQFDIIGGAKPYSRFLEGTPEGDPDKYEVSFQSGKWVVACGIIQGLPPKAQLEKVATSMDRAVTLDVFDFEGNLIQTTSLQDVGPAFSTLTDTDKLSG